MSTGLPSLVAPLPGRLGPVDGLRAIAVTWVVAFHGVLFYGMALTPSAVPALVAPAWSRAALQGDLGVDLFFVISGFLIARMLLDEHEATGRIRLGRFWARRALRLLPAYWVTMALVAAIVPKQPVESAWANLLYVNNFITLPRTFMPWTWSLAIEEQFYLVAPLLLVALGAPRRRHLGLFLGLAAACVAWRLHALGAMGLGAAALPTLPPWFAGKQMDPAFLASWDGLYVLPHLRGGALALGMAAAYVARSAGAMAWLGRPAVGAAVAAVGAMLVALPLAVPRLGPNGAPRPLGEAASLAYLAAYNHVFALGAALVLLATLAATGGPARWLAALLSHAAFRPAARLSYAAYLLNPVAAGVVFTAIVPRLGGGEVAAAPLWAAASVGLTFALALPLYLGVEAPFMALRARFKVSR